MDVDRAHFHQWAGLEQVRVRYEQLAAGFRLLVCENPSYRCGLHVLG